VLIDTSLVVDVVDDAVLVGGGAVKDCRVIDSEVSVIFGMSVGWLGIEGCVLLAGTCGEHVGGHG
jgi:hypothetical protein